mmetsp:Transcript_17293/g.41356  ORF Transcript_17293/g.41356 Transcript_17293/m.41356 type:complete len:276 (+) Transcript_17293:480-1307(+)
MVPNPLNLRQLLWHHNDAVGERGESIDNESVAFVVPNHALRQVLDERPHDGRGELRHSTRKVGHAEHRRLTQLLRRTRVVLAIATLVRAREVDRLRHHLVRACGEEATLPGVDHFVRLGRVARHDAVEAKLTLTVEDATPMGTVLDQREPVLLADLHDSVHITHPPTHVREQQHLRLRRGSLLLQVVEVHRPRARRLHEHWRRVEAHDCRRQRGEREPIREDLVACLHADEDHRQHDRGGARVHAQRVLVLHQPRELRLRRGDLRVCRAVAEEAA